LSQVARPSDGLFTNFILAVYGVLLPITTSLTFGALSVTISHFEVLGLIVIDCRTLAAVFASPIQA